MKTLHIVSPNAAGSALFDLQVLSQTEPAAHRVCFLGNAPPNWPSTTIPTDSLGWRHWLDFRPLWGLARLAKNWRPEVLVAWDLCGLRLAKLAAPRICAAVVIRNSEALSCQGLTVWDKRCLAAAKTILTATHADAARWEAGGFRASSIRVVSPAALYPIPAGEPDRPRIVCFGPLEREYGFHQAIWTFDILQFVDDRVELVIVGDGSQRRRLEDFARRIGMKDRIRFPGPMAAEEAMAKASVVWVPSVADCGSEAAVQAMAAGKAVAGSRWPALSEVVVDKETGLLVKPGNPVALAQVTKSLLDDVPLRKRMGEAGRRRAVNLFSADAFVKAWQQAVA
jgi:glycosyltransferase involved in cell wall biosynthesis